MAINRPRLPPSSLLSPLPPPLPSPMTPPIPSENLPIQGDPATRRFGLFFLSALALVTIAVIIGIGVGNIAHYRYFGPYDRSVFDFTQYYNSTLM